MSVIAGERVELRRATQADVPALAPIRNSPEVRRRWLDGDVAEEIASIEAYVIVCEGRIVGMIQCDEETDPMYRHANIDLYVDAAWHGKGIGTDAVRAMARHLIRDRGHHRIVIDPAADNAAAIRAYSKVGFRPVGVMRQYERGADGTWHDGLLMELLAGELS